MPTSTLLEYVVQDLKDKYNPHTLILYGSRAINKETPTSDIDIACFCEDTEPLKDARIFEGVYLDAWIYPTKAMQTITEEELRFVGGVLLLDTEGKGKAYLKQIEELFNKGPDKLSPEDTAHIKIWVEKMLLRIQETDLKSQYRAQSLKTDLLPLYFQLRNRWFLGDTRSFAYLKKEDPVAYHLFKTVYAPDNGTPHNGTVANNALQELAHHVLKKLPPAQAK